MNWTEEFDKQFYEGENNSIFCKQDNLFATPFEMKQFISQELEKAREEGRQEIGIELRQYQTEEDNNIRQAERARIIKLVKGMWKFPDEFGNYKYIGWNSALDAIIKKIETI